MMLGSQPTIVLLALTAIAAAASAQDRKPVAVSLPETTVEQAVTSAAVRSGKLILVGTNATRRYTLPSGVYTNETGGKMVVRDGLMIELALFKPEIGGLKAHASEYFGDPLNKVTGTPSVSKVPVETLEFTHMGFLEATAPTGELVTIPDGIYKSEDGRSSLTISSGRPTRFALPRSAQVVTGAEVPRR